MGHIQIQYIAENYIILFDAVYLRNFPCSWYFPPFLHSIFFCSGETKKSVLTQNVGCMDPRGMFCRHPLNLWFENLEIAYRQFP